MLVLAGAGSGKTRVLTYRIAWLIEALDVSPLSILAVTFTNKAALEMRQRIETILGFPMAGFWIGTFHGISHRLLRAHCREADLPESFEILDADDQYRLIRRILRNSISTKATGRRGKCSGLLITTRKKGVVLPS